jgi:hypothetical protein
MECALCRRTRGRSPSLAHGDRAGWARPEKTRSTIRVEASMTWPMPWPGHWCSRAGAGTRCSRILLSVLSESAPRESKPKKTGTPPIAARSAEAASSSPPSRGRPPLRSPRPDAQGSLWLSRSSPESVAGPFGYGSRRRRFGGGRRLFALGVRGRARSPPHVSAPRHSPTTPSSTPSFVSTTGAGRVCPHGVQEGKTGTMR